MYCYVRIANLASCALYDLLSKDKNRREIDMGTLGRYGIQAVKELNKEEGVRAILLFTRDDARRFAQDYSDIFELKEEGTPREKIVLKAGKTKEDVLHRASGSMSVRIIKALTSQNVLSCLYENVA